MVNKKLKLSLEIPRCPSYINSSNLLKTFRILGYARKYRVLKPVFFFIPHEPPHFYLTLKCHPQSVISL